MFFIYAFGGKAHALSCRIMPLFLRRSQAFGAKWIWYCGMSRISVWADILWCGELIAAPACTQQHTSHSAHLQQLF